MIDYSKYTEEDFAAMTEDEWLEMRRNPEPLFIPRESDFGGGGLSRFDWVFCILGAVIIALWAYFWLWGGSG